MATYIPNATQTTEPVESRTVESAALEFRTLKASINGRIEDVQDDLDAEIVNRIAGDANLQTQNNNQDVRLTAIENALPFIGEGVVPGTVYVQRFSGTGAQTAFTLDVVPQSGNVVDIYINGLYQNKNTFSVAGAVITFSEAPPAGTDNIEVQVTVTIALGETDASLVTYSATTVEAQLDAVSAAGGSSLVGFQQAGAGAVVRTAQDKMRELVSVKDFGAVGDGVADDTAALANAIAWATSGTRKRTLFFPAGVYVTTTMLDVNKPTAVLVGEGRYNSVIKFTGSGVAVSFTDANPNNGAFTFGGGIEDICIEGNANATSLLYVDYVNHFCAKNVNLREANTVSGVGLHILGTVLGYFENVYCSTNAQLMASRPQNGIVVDRSTTTLSRATANTFIHCVVEGMTGDGIQLVNSDQSAFFGGTSENNNGNGVTIAPGSRMNTFVSTAFENSSGTTFADISDNGFSNRFVNCYSKKLIYIGAASQFSQVEGGFHQRITVTGDFATLQDLKYSFFSAGGTVTTTTDTSTRNLFNADTSALTFNTKAPTTPTVTASPYTYTNGSGRDEEVIVNGGAVTQIVFNRGGPIATLPTSGMFRLAPQDKLVISYSSAPTVTVVPFGTNFI